MNSKTFIIFLGFLFAAVFICSTVVAETPNDENKLEVAAGTNQVDDSKYPCRFGCCGYDRFRRCRCCSYARESQDFDTEATTKEEESNQVADTKDGGHGGGSGRKGGSGGGKGGGSGGNGGSSGGKGEGSGSGGGSSGKGGAGGGGKGGGGGGGGEAYEEDGYGRGRGWGGGHKGGGGRGHGGGGGRGGAYEEDGYGRGRGWGGGHRGRGGRGVGGRVYEEDSYGGGYEENSSEVNYEVDGGGCRYGCCFRGKGGCQTCCTASEAQEKETEAKP